MGGVSLRQPQWWHERKLVTPLTIAALRRKGLSLQKVRKILRQLRREWERNSGRAWSGSNLYLLTDGKSMILEDQPEVVLDRLVRANKPGT